MSENLYEVHCWLEEMEGGPQLLSVGLSPYGVKREVGAPAAFPTETSVVLPRSVSDEEFGRVSDWLDVVVVGLAKQWLGDKGFKFSKAVTVKKKRIENGEGELN